MPAVVECVSRDVRGKVSSSASEQLQEACANAGECLGVGASPDGGKTLVAVTESGVSIAYDKSPAVSYSYDDLHSISVIGQTDPALFIPLQRGLPFDWVQLGSDDANRLAGLARPRIAAVHEAGSEWWDTPTGDLGILVWPAGLLTRPPDSPVPQRQWCTVSFVNTGVQIRTTRNPQQPSVYKSDVREFLPWTAVHSVAVEGLDQIERRPSVGAVLLFGVMGLGASREIRRAYLTIEAEHGDYVFERQELLPLELSGFLAPVLRQMRSSSSAPDDTMQQVLDAQVETNRLLGEILDALRGR